jgi:hypothetical protein
MTVDLGALIGDLERSLESASSNGVVYMPVHIDTIKTAIAAIEDSQAKLQEIGETIASGWINLAGFNDPEFTGLAVPVEDIKDILEGGEYPVTLVFFDAYNNMLAERNALQEQIRSLSAASASQATRPQIENTDPRTLREDFAREIHDSYRPDDGSYFASRDTTPNYMAYAAADAIIALLSPELESLAAGTCRGCNLPITAHQGRGWEHDHNARAFCEDTEDLATPTTKDTE